MTVSPEVALGQSNDIYASQSECSFLINGDAVEGSLAGLQNNDNCNRADSIFISMERTEYDQELLNDIKTTLNASNMKVYVSYANENQDEAMFKEFMLWVTQLNKLVFLKVQQFRGRVPLESINTDLKCYFSLDIAVFEEFQADIFDELIGLYKSGLRVVSLRVYVEDPLSKAAQTSWKTLDALIKERGCTIAGELSFTRAKSVTTVNGRRLRLVQQKETEKLTSIDFSNSTVRTVYQTKKQLYTFLKNSLVAGVTSVEIEVDEQSTILNKAVLKSLLLFLERHKAVMELQLKTYSVLLKVSNQTEEGRKITALLNQRETQRFTYLLMESDKGSAYNRTKLILVGKGGAGKTSCLRALLGQPFVKDHLSTVVANVDNNVSLMDSKDVNIGGAWKEIKVNNQQGMFFRDFQIMGKAVAKEHEPVLEKKLEEDENETFKKQKDFTEVENLSELMRGNKIETKNVEQRKKNFPAKEGNVGRIGKFVGKMKNRFDNDAKDELDEELTGMKLVLWDFGGQDVFDTAHHFYFTNQGLVLLVFDLQNWINNREEEKTHIEKWLNSLMYYAPNSHVFIAGTRAECDEVKSVGTTSISEAIDVILGEYGDVIIVENSANDLCFFPIENSSPLNNGKYLLPLRKAIKEVLEEPIIGEAIWKKQVSLAWLFFMHVVEQQGRNVTSLNQLHNFGNEKGFSEEEIKKMLDFFTDAGAIVSFRTRFDKLRLTSDLIDDTVIRPKWLIKSLSLFLFDTIHTKNAANLKKIKNMRRWIKLHRKGILARSLFQNILVNQDSLPREDIFLAHLCEMMMVMSRVRSNDVDKFLKVKKRLMDTEEYFWVLPSMNVEPCPVDVINKVKYTDTAQILQIRWQDAVPQGCFERFTCSFIKHCDGREGLEFQSLYKNLASLEFRELEVAIEKQSRNIFNVIIQSKAEDAVLAIKDVIESVLYDLQNLGLAIKLNADIFLVKNPKPNIEGPFTKLKPRKSIIKKMQPITVAVAVAANAVPWDFDCFLSHSWGEHPEFLTHEQVVHIGGLLEDKGYKVWLDKNELKQTVSDAIHLGIDGSSCFIAFITKKYMLSANNRDNNAGKEFNYATKNGVDKIIPVLLDGNFKGPEMWKGNAGFHLPNALYIDFTTPEQIEANMGALCKRIKELSTEPRPEYALYQ